MQTADLEDVPAASSLPAGDTAGDTIKDSAEDFEPFADYDRSEIDPASLGNLRTAWPALLELLASEPVLIGRMIGTMVGQGRRVEAEAAYDAWSATMSAAAEPDVTVLLTLADAAQALERLSDAASWLEKALVLAPEDPDIHARLGAHLESQGLWGRAYPHLAAAAAAEEMAEEMAEGMTEGTAGKIGAIRSLADAVGVPPDDPGLRQPDSVLVALARRAAKGVTPYPPVPGRVIHVTTALASGGAERQVVTVMRSLARPQIGLESVTLLCESLNPQRQYDFFLPLLADSPCEVVALDQRPLPDSWRDRPELAPFASLLERVEPAPRRHFLIALVLEFLARRPSIVQGWQDEAGTVVALAAVIAGVPKVFIRAASLRPGKLRERKETYFLKFRHMEELYKALLAIPSVTLLNNSAAGAADYADWLGIPAEAIGVLLNGVDGDSLSSPGANETTPAAAGLSADQPIVGSVFRPVDEKRPMLWMETAAIIAAANPRVRFAVLGDGPMHRAMIAFAKARGFANRLVMPGRITDVASWLALMDVFLLTSRVEGLPNVVLEAQWAGLPVVSANVGGVAEIVAQGRTGWYVDDPTPALLAERVLWCLTHRAWRDRVPAIVEEEVMPRFGIPAMTRTLLNFYGSPPGRVP